MQHVKTPDETGWYWIEAGGDWYMAHLDCDGDSPKLLVCDAPNRSFAVWRAAQPDRWIGPLTCPGGDFGGAIYEFDAELHEQAATESKAMVMVVADFTHDSRHGGTLCSAGLMPGVEAIEAAGAVFARQDAEAKP